MTEFPPVDLGLVVPVFNPEDDPIACLNNAMAFLIVVASLRGDKGKVILVLVIRVMLLLMGETIEADGKGLLNARTVKTEDLNTYDSDYDDVSNAKAVLMANISNYGSDVISEVLHSNSYYNDMDNQSVHAMQDFKQTPVVDMRYIAIAISFRILNTCKKHNRQLFKKLICYQNPFYPKKAQRIKPTLYDGSVIADKHVVIPVINDEETLILEEVSQSKMFEKEKDLEAIKQKISHKPIDYAKLNQLSEDFGKCFVLQQEVLAEQAFWYHMSNPSTESSDASPVKVEAPSELP
ncbi:hypothetical protein Tco_0773297 [Tanacetum coccineum]|uniref:Uncharacterized protein n=1 Tax=Tanacetum coccineum TaxID=301880 RepID=A0ABQ4ZMY1_9ASTR